MVINQSELKTDECKTFVAINFVGFLYLKSIVKEYSEAAHIDLQNLYEEILHKLNNDCYHGNDLISVAFKWDETWQGESFWFTCNNKWIEHLQNKINFMNEEKNTETPECNSIW